MPRTFDSTRLRPFDAQSVSARHCARTQALVAACRLGAGPGNAHWASPGGPVRIEMPFGCYQVDDAEIVRRAALLLDGTWRMADASAAGRLAIRAHALWTDLAWWRPLADGDAWDAGEAVDADALAGFEPRRTTLIVVSTPPGEALARTLADLERRAPTWRRAVRVLLLGAPPGWARHLTL